MTEDEINNILNLLSAKQIKRPEIEFRLYYDETGKVKTYTSEKLPGNYIVITREQYAEARNDVLVVDGKIKYTSKNTHIFRYVKNMEAGIKTSKYDINIITERNYVFWNYEQCEIK